MYKFNVTYSIITPESAELITSSGWRNLCIMAQNLPHTDNARAAIRKAKGETA